ncbi:MAG: ankyrin repeat domain-containing protein [Paracoccaceae bacterium]
MYQVAQNSHDPRVFQLLVDAGADLDAVELFGATPLFNAVKAGNLVATQFFVEQGANAHHLDNRGNSVLHVAVGNCRKGGFIGERGIREKSILEYLVQIGIDVAHPNDKGLSPIDIAKAKCGDPDVVGVLTDP